MLISSAIGAYAQLPEANFSVSSDTLCREELLEISNSSKNAENFSWDFCLGSFSGEGSDITLDDLPIGTSFGSVFELQNDTIVAFVTDQPGNLYRGTFDMNLVEIDPISQITTVGGGLTEIHLVEKDGVWFGFIGTTSGVIYKLIFGSNLQSNELTITELFDGDGLEGVFGISTISEESGDYLLTIGGGSNNGELTVFSFTNGFNNDDYTHTEYLIPQGNFLLGISMIRENGIHSGSIVGGSGLHIAQFNNGLANSPDLTFKSGVLSQARDVVLVRELDSLYGFVTSNNAGNLYRLNFGNEIRNDPRADLLGN
jgi:hypothetical protein